MLPPQSLTRRGGCLRSVGGTTGAGSHPGAFWKLDQTIGEGLVREVLEETGLTVELEALTGVYKNMRCGIVALVFRCRVVDGQVGVSAEAAKVAWLSAEEVAERMAYAMRLLGALRPGPPAVRAHDGLVLLPA